MRSLPPRTLTAAATCGQDVVALHTLRMATAKMSPVQVTEGILYSLLPSLLTAADAHYSRSHCSMPPDAYVQVASATLAASCLLNAPPGFIEFLLCTPWHQMDLIQAGSDLESLLGVVDITTAQRTQVVNTPLASHLISVLMDFIYQDRHLASLPPMLIITHDEQGNTTQPQQPLAPANGESPATPVQSWPPVAKPVRITDVDSHVCPHCRPQTTHAL